MTVSHISIEITSRSVRPRSRARETHETTDAGLAEPIRIRCIGAANALANPKRALRVLPGALYELGVAVVVSLSVAPQLVESVQRVRRARKLRGGTGVGLHALREVAIPVLEDALERSLQLAAAMDSRGYGRTGRASRRSRRVTGVLMIAGMCGLCVGASGLLDPSVPRLMGLPALAGGTEWLVALSGLVPAAVLVAGFGFSAGSVNPSTYPLVWPELPAVPALAILVAAVAAIAAPPPTRPARTQTQEEGPSRPKQSDPTASAGERPGRLGVPA